MKVDDNQANVSACVCPDCPTFDDCARDKGETLYCARTTSVCDLKQEGCICPDCSVWADYELSDLYFCTEGPAT